MPRENQGSTRHGLPHKDGVLYASTLALSAVAERIKPFRGRTISEDDLWFGDYRWALAIIEIDASIDLLDLTDPHILVEKKIDMVSIGTKDRAISQQLADRLYEMGAPGCLWASAIESSWANVSLFQSRLKNKLRVHEPIKPLTFTMSDFVDAAKAIGVAFKRSH